MVLGRVKLRGSSHIYDSLIDPSVGTFELNGQRYHADDLLLDVPVTGTLYGTLLNYQGTLTALGDAVHNDPYKKPPEAPILYIKPVNTMACYGAPIPLPADVQELEMGAALGVVIGKTATRVPEERALDYVTGYTVVNDVSVPHQSVYRPAVREKARDGFCPIGPWVIERGAVKNPNDLSIRLYINEELRQENTTQNLIRSVERLIADVTNFMTLYAGDILLVGVPENAPLAKAGDRVRIEIDGVGVLKNVIVREGEMMT